MNAQTQQDSKTKLYEMYSTSFKYYIDSEVEESHLKGSGLV